MTTATAPARRRRRTPTGPAATAGTLDAKLTRLYALKVAADEAKAALDKAKTEFHADLEAESKTEHSIPADGDRPAVKAKIATRTTQTVDVAKFADAVSPEEFVAAATVGVTAAKRYLGEAQLEKISDKTSSAPFLDVRALGANRK